jgi:hypothetical protein
MRKKRKNRSEVDILKDKAWTVFSKYIRLRDPYCVTCLEEGKQVISENAGHFYHNCLDFHEDNVNGQCVRCNKWLSGNLSIYSNYLLRKLGQQRFDELYILHYRDMKSQKREAEYYKEIIDTYEKKIEELAKKGL